VTGEQRTAGEVKEGGRWQDRGQSRDLVGREGGFAGAGRAVGWVDMPVWWSAKPPAALPSDWAGSGSLASVPVSGRWGFSRRRCSPRSRSLALAPWAGAARHHRDPRLRGVIPRAGRGTGAAGLWQCQAGPRGWGGLDGQMDTARHGEELCKGLLPAGG